MSRVRCGAGTKHMSLLPTEVAPYLVGTLCLAVPQLQTFPTTSVGTRLGFVPLLSTECPNEVRCNLCGGEGHVSGSCPTSYSARASADVGPAHEPSQSGPEPMVEEPRSPSPDEVAHQVEQDFLAAKQCEGVSGTPEAGPPSSSSSTPGEAGLLTVENDLQLSSDSETDSAMSDAGGPASEPPPKEPPSGEGWFDLCEGVETESKLKRSASPETLTAFPTHSSTECLHTHLRAVVSALRNWTCSQRIMTWLTFGECNIPAWPCSLGTALMARTPQGWTGCTLHLLCHRVIVKLWHVQFRTMMQLLSPSNPQSHGQQGGGSGK
ncbi:hypothetical protein HOLleu_16708 [Holothuria leucospilota]|uniref:CCHC-type domain-containing protein n=1 Tax=Holothuria leucospilota TaxID=206669 RepID=A0A9Q1C5N6_HOLLE|nr:hypothetical protein HOLleu_16708 [Holothuria leucospilota]